jgi:hypothetical protein
MSASAPASIYHPADPASDVVNALRLGWTLAELLGRIRKGARPPGLRPRQPDYAPRLTAGHGTVERSSTGLVFTAHRLLALAAVLDVRCVDDPELQQRIEELPTTIERWLAGYDDNFYTPAQIRQLLEHWSLRAWAQLNARSDAAVLAFTLGMSLADTYWYLRKPAQRPKERVSEEDWTRLLSVYRLAVERDRLAMLRPYLPNYLVTTLRSHLNDWSIGTELERAPDGTLRRVPFYTRTSHPLGWRISPAAWSRASTLYRLTHFWGYLPAFQRPNRVPEVTADEEITLQENLKRQAEVWRSLIFGLRPPTGYLQPADRISIRLLNVGCATGLVLIFGLALTALTWLIGTRLFPLAAQLLPGLADLESAPGSEVRGWLALLVQVVPGLGVLGVLGLTLYRVGRWIYQHWTDFVASWLFVRRRTLKRWNHRLG